MPEICRFFGIVIEMHWFDHFPPHFHSRYESRSCAIDIRDGVVRWPGDLDLAPDAMYDELKRTGLWLLEPFPEPG